MKAGDIIICIKDHNNFQAGKSYKIKLIDNALEENDKYVYIPDDDKYWGFVKHRECCNYPIIPYIWDIFENIRDHRKKKLNKIDESRR